MSGNTESDRDPKRRTKRSDFVSSELASMIHSAGLRPGSRLPSEKQLMEDLRVGRPALREALRILEIRGLVRIQTGRAGGAIVLEPDDSVVADSVSFLLAFRGATLSDVLHARLILEPTIVALAAEDPHPSDVAELELLARSLAQPTAGRAKPVAERDLFHLKLARMCGNPLLEIFSQVLKHVIDRVDYDGGYSTHRHAEVAEHHLAIFDAVRREDPEAAAAAAREHIVEIQTYWQERHPKLLYRALQLENPLAAAIDRVAG